MIPKIINGNSHKDERGMLLFNNNFDVSTVRRIYFIENKDTEFIRGWQGHKIEQRWFSVIQGEFRIQLIAIDNWVIPSKDLKIFDCILKKSNFDVLHVPAGYISSIQSLDSNSKLMVMSDYFLGEIKDEYRFDADYFNEE
ncbi:sugar epimerase [Flavobacterium sp. LB1P62]|uniref:sugar epimerase n=1 Tax=Flavobacterium sp. LB1P62 TaxID=3401715 RepID=UPI003AACAD92